MAIDDLIAACGLTASQVMATLSVLEMRRLVRRLPGPPVRPRLSLAQPATSAMPRPDRTTAGGAGTAPNGRNAVAIESGVSTKP